MATSKMLEIPFEVRDGGTFLLDPVGSYRIFTLEDLTEEQREMKAVAMRFASEQVLPHIADIEAKKPGLMRSLLQQAGELGLLGIEIPDKYDGLEQDKTTSMLIAATLARCASFAVSMGAHVGIGTLPLVYYGTVEQKQKYLPKLATGEWIAAYALTETGSGSDALAAKTRAELSEDGSHYSLTGDKQFITNAGFADLFVIFAQVGGDKFTAFLVERDTPGLTIGAEEHKHGIKGSSTCQLHLDGARVPAENVLGLIGKGHRIAFNILNVGRARLGIGSIGTAKYALDLAVRYASERKQFGQKLVEFGLIRAKIGEMAWRIYAGDSMGFRTAGLIDKKYHALEELSPGPDDDDFQVATEEYTIESSIIKVFGSEVLDYVADESLQIHGGYGYITEYPIERVSRDSRINRIFEGTNEINRLLIAGELLKRAMRNRIPLMPAVQGANAALSAGQEPEFELRGDWLLEEQRQVERMKMALMYATSQAIQRYMMAIKDQQVILGAMADMLIALYAADSAVARALQHGSGLQHSEFFADCTTLTVERSADRLFSCAENILCAVLDQDNRQTGLSRLAVLRKRRALDRFGLRDRIASRMLESDSWTFR